jgi:hypothetical protein
MRTSCGAGCSKDCGHGLSGVRIDVAFQLQIVHTRASSKARFGSIGQTEGHYCLTLIAAHGTGQE